MHEDTLFIPANLMAALADQVIGFFLYFLF